jgi:hypothetical protein
MLSFPYCAQDGISQPGPSKEPKEDDDSPKKWQNTLIGNDEEYFYFLNKLESTGKNAETGVSEVSGRQLRRFRWGDNKSVKE